MAGKELTVNAATPQVSIALVRVTWSAGPRPRPRCAPGPHESCPRDHGAREADRRAGTAEAHGRHQRGEHHQLCDQTDHRERGNRVHDASFSIGLDPRTRHASPGFIRRRLARVSPCPVLHARSGWSSLRGEIDRWSCGRQGQVKCWCARCTPASVGEQTLVFRGGSRQSVCRDARAVRPATSRGRSSTDTSSVGMVEDGPSHLLGRTVFSLFPHQTAVVPPTRLSRCPMTFLRCAVLAGTVETAVNALWDAAPLLGDRVAVVGAGMVGCCVARLLGRIPGARVTLVDVAPPGLTWLPRSAWTSRWHRRRRKPSRAATSSCMPVPPPPASSRPWTCLRRRAP